MRRSQFDTHVIVRHHWRKRQRECASNPQRASRGDLRLDTETVSRIRHAAVLGQGASTVAPATGAVMASTLGQSMPLLLALVQSDNAVGELEKRLVECARLAERQVNSAHFGNRSPTREECGEEVEVDGCAEPITRAMLLGQQKHALALHRPSGVGGPKRASGPKTIKRQFPRASRRPRCGGSRMPSTRPGRGCPALMHGRGLRCR